MLPLTNSDLCLVRICTIFYSLWDLNVVALSFLRFLILYEVSKQITWKVTRFLKLLIILCIEGYLLEGTEAA